MILSYTWYFYKAFEIFNVFMLRSWHDILQNNLEREYKSLTSCVCCTSMNVFLLPWSFSFLSSLLMVDIYIQCKRGNVNEIFPIVSPTSIHIGISVVWQAIPKLYSIILPWHIEICLMKRNEIQCLYIKINLAKLLSVQCFVQQFDLRWKITIFVVCVVPLRL